jgi:Protein of unknown function (DUF3048) N-terminal domain/Protein of unknown function (DUF3048) C-terminal domain
MRIRRVAALFMALAAVLPACSGNGKSAAPGQSGSPGAPGAPATVPGPPVYPLTGLPVTDAGKAGRPALVVKIDNADGGGKGNSARPQSGLNAADVVYEEMVEGSVTRFGAIFQSGDADPVGPIRSARLTDIDVFTPLTPLFAWSGGNPTVSGAIRGSKLVDIGFDAASQAYNRRSGKVAPHNLYSSTPSLYGVAPAGGAAPPPLFQYRPAGQAPPAGGRPAGNVHLAFRDGPAGAPVDWRWDAGSGTFLRSQRGTPDVDEGGQQINPVNVLVQLTPYHFNGDADVAGNPVPQADLVGSGACHLLSAGVIVDCTWSKASAEAVTTYADAAGAPLRLTPGRTWVELVPTDGTYAEG